MNNNVNLILSLDPKSVTLLYSSLTTQTCSFVTLGGLGDQFFYYRQDAWNIEVFCTWGDGGAPAGFCSVPLFLEEVVE